MVAGWEKISLRFPASLRDKPYSMGEMMMRPIQVLRLLGLVVLAGAAGCSSDNVGKLEGTSWRCDQSTVQIQSGGKSQSVNVPEGFLMLEFRGDGSMVYGVGGQNYTGKYSLGPGKTVTFHLDRPLAGRNSHIESIEVDGEKMTVSDMDGTSIRFRNLRKSLKDRISVRTRAKGTEKMSPKRVA